MLGLCTLEKSPPVHCKFNIITSFYSIVNGSKIKLLSISSHHGQIFVFVGKEHISFKSHLTV